MYCTSKAQMMNPNQEGTSGAQSIGTMATKQIASEDEAAAYSLPRNT